MQGELNPATTILEIRDRDNRVIYTRDDNGPAVTNPMTPAEAYLPHFILEGNTDPARNILWGERARLVTPDGQRRPAGFKTGTTNDFRDVSGLRLRAGQPDDRRLDGEQQPGADVERVLGRPLQRRRPALPVAGVHAAGAEQPVGLERAGSRCRQTSFDQPPGIVQANVCRFSGMSAGNCGGERAITLPFLEGTVPPLDNVHFRGCLDLEAYIAQSAPDAARQLDRRRRHLVGPPGQRPDRAARRPGAATRTTCASSSPSRRSTASVASPRSAASACARPRASPDTPAGR